MAAFGVYRSIRRPAPPEMHKGAFVVEPVIPVGTTLESEYAYGARKPTKSLRLITATEILD